MVDDGWTAYHKVHEILKANRCNSYRSCAFVALRPLNRTSIIDHSVEADDSQVNSQVCEAMHI